VSQAEDGGGGEGNPQIFGNFVFFGRFLTENVKRCPKKSLTPSAIFANFSSLGDNF